MCHMKQNYFQRMNEIYFSKYMFWLILAIYLSFSSISVNGIVRTKIIKKVGRQIFRISPLKRKILKKYTAIKHNDFTRIFFLRITQYYIYIQYGYILFTEVCITKFLYIHNLHIFLTCKIRQLISYREKPPYIIRSLGNHKSLIFPLALNKGIFQ